MYTLHSLRLKNIVYFKDAFVRLDKHPLTFVRGLNLDSLYSEKSTGQCEQPTSNGAGKSLLFSCIPNLFYFSPPSATRKNSKKELLKKGSSNTLRLTTPEDVKFEITQTVSGYIIKENGRDLKFTRIPDAEKFIRNVFPLTETDYYTYCYVSTSRPYLFQSDTNLNRLDHLTTIFRLDSYDKMRAHFVKMLAQVKGHAIRLSVLEQKLLEDKLRLKSLLAKKDTIDQSSKSKLRAKQKSLSQQLEAVKKSEYQLTQMVSTLDTLKNIEKELDILRKEYTYVDKPDVMYKNLIKERKLVREHENYISSKQTYNKTVLVIRGKIKRLKVPDTTRKLLSTQLNTIKRRIVDYETKIRALEEIKQKYTTQLNLVRELKLELKELNVRVDLKADYHSELAQCVATLKLSALLDHEHFNEDESSCPVCFSSIDLVNIRRAVKAAKKRFPIIKALTKAKSLITTIGQEEAKLKELTLDTAPLDTFYTELDVLNCDKKHIEYQITVVEKHAELTEQLESIELPKRPRKDPTRDLSLDEVDQQLELCSTILKHLEAKSRLLENTFLEQYRTVALVNKALVSKKKDLKLIVKEVTELRTKLARVSDDLEKASILESEIDILAQNIVRSEKDILELKPSVNDKVVLETLIKAYSTKGLKTLIANEVCSLIETNLNLYSDLVFAEPFTFSINVSETGLSILVDRGNGVISDVRNLSGAESNSFRMLFVLSILPLIPNERRLNLLVLDEPCSHSDSVSREIFLTKFLPVLSEVVPNVVVITPNKDDYIKGSVELIVKKEGGVSSLHRSLK